MLPLPFHAPQVPSDSDDRDETKDAAAVIEVEEAVPKIHTRTQMSEFTDKYGAITNLNRAMLRNMYNTLTTNAGAATNSEQRDLDERVIQFVASVPGAAGPDIGLWPDLRALNGNTGEK